MSKLSVAVLMGGVSAERAISLSTGRQIAAALDRDKYEVTALDAAALTGQTPPALPPGTPAAIAETAAALVPAAFGELAPRHAGRPDVVFIALHGKGGEDGTIQGALELLGIPYTGSGVLASALAMDKARTKRVLQSDGIAVPRDVVLGPAQRDNSASAAACALGALALPVVVKPNAQGSTIGCRIVRDAADLPAAIDEAFHYDSTVLIEEFVQGVEITAGVLGNEEPLALPLIEITTASGFYDYEAKYAPGGSAHLIPARISESAAHIATDYALRCHTLLGCRGMSRTDMIVAGDQPIVLEVNTIPGMTPTSLLPDAARAAGISFPELLDRLIRYALE